MDIRQFLFKYRSYTPIPLVLLLLLFAKPYVPAIYFGFFFLVLGEAIRIWGVSHAGGRTRTRNVGAAELCTSGPFAYVRNPLYLGNVIIYIGVVLIAGGSIMWPLLVLTLLFFSFQYSQIVSLEEETLTRLFKDEYLIYCKNVPALIPRLTPWEGKTKHTPLNINKVLRPEKSTLINLLLIIILIYIRSHIQFT